MHKRHNISISHDVYARLQDRGKFGETFSDVIRAILDLTDRRKAGGELAA
jgi:predicted CopG family antitoxin